MMKLHKNKELFLSLIEATSEKFGLQEEYVEKDYFASLLLKNIVELKSETVFKGGTSLSKCYRLINRFSEDIDINYKLEEKVTQGERKSLNHAIQVAINNADLELLNKDSVRSNRLHNEYEVKYPTMTHPTGALKDILLVEYYLFIKSFPYQKRLVNDYISDYLIDQNEFSIIKDYDLGGFESYVQTLDRTFMDKLFAICDYYESGKTMRLSRHLYDLHMIWTSTEFDGDKFKKLFHLVSEERSNNKKNLSATEGFPIKKTLQMVINSDYFKNDYHSNTKLLLFDQIDYETVKSSLQEITDSDLIPENIELRITN